MSINYETVKKALYDWMISVIPLNMPVIYWQNNSPRPEIPYVTLFLNNIVMRNQDWTQPRVNTLADANMKGDRQFTLSIQVFGTNDPLTILENVRSSLQKQSVLDTLRTNGIVFFQSLNIADITEILETQFEKRASLDVLFGIGQTYIDNLGFFDHAQIEQTIKDINGDVIINRIIEVPEI